MTGYNCEKCKNRGFSRRIRYDEYYKRWELVTVVCDCVELRKKIALELKNIESSGIADLLKTYTFENYKTFDDWQNAILAQAHAYANDPQGWMYIGGQPGSGKTHICTAMVNQFLKEGKAVRYMLWNEDIPKLKARANDADVFDGIINALKNADVLYIDDFFKTKSMTAADVNITFRILNHRYIKKLPTIITSELSIAQVHEIDEALASRIAEMMGRRYTYIAKDESKNYRYRQKTWFRGAGTK